MSTHIQLEILTPHFDIKYCLSFLDVSREGMFLILFIIIIFNPHQGICLLILEIEEGRKGERERNINQLPPICAPNGDQTHNPGMCPHREGNPHTFWC